MFCLSYFSPINYDSIVFAFIQPVQAVPVSDSENHLNCSSPTGFASGSSYQETKEAHSPLSLNEPIFEKSKSYTKLKIKSLSNKLPKQKLEEEQFKPNVPEAKKSRKTPQNANRNVVPNIMHQVISFLQKRNKSEKLVEKLIKDLGAEEFCSVKRFYLYQTLVKDKLNHYVNAESLIVLNQVQEPSCEVYSQQEQRHYNKISRLLVQYFLTREYDTIILTSKRVNSDKKLDHLSIKRKILEQIKGMFQEQD